MAHREVGLTEMGRFSRLSDRFTNSLRTFTIHIAHTAFVKMKEGIVLCGVEDIHSAQYIIRFRGMPHGS